MWLGIQRLVDLIIEFMIKRARGETFEERVIMCYKNMVIIIAVLLWAGVILGIMVINAKLDLKDFEENNVLVQNVLTGDNSVISSFVDTTKELNQQLLETRQDNVTLIRDKYDLIEFNKTLLIENLKLKDELKQCKK